METRIDSYNSILSDIRKIISAGRDSAYVAVNSISIMTYWNIGKRIIDGDFERMRSKSELDPLQISSTRSG